MLESRISVPWGEVAPGAGCATATADDLLALPDDGWRYEVVEGVLIRVAGSGVASPGQCASDLAAKVQRYLSGGMGIVWVVWPLLWEIDVWYPAEVTLPTIMLRAGDILDGGVVVPGYTHPVADLFDLL